MADTSGMNEIRGIDIDRLAKGFADESLIMKKFVSVTPTKAREIRWYQKTSGFLEATSPADIENVEQGTQPFVLEQSWTRNTSYVRKYFVESPILSDEDIKDTDVDILATNIRDLVRAVGYKIDSRIWDVITESQSAVNINEVSISNEWDDPTNATIIEDIMEAKEKIRENGYDPERAIFLMNAATHTDLMNWLISEKGSSIPSFSSDRVKDGVVMEILGLSVVVNQIVTSDYAAIFVPQRAATWKSFIPIKAVGINDAGIGTKIRVWEEGEAILTDPKAVTLLSNIGPS